VFDVVATIDVVGAEVGVVVVLPLPSFVGSSLSESTDELRSDRSLLSRSSVTVAVKDADPKIEKRVMKISVHCLYVIKSNSTLVRKGKQAKDGERILH
jgi:hypothetical protein